MDGPRTNDRDELVRIIRSVSVEPGQTLRQVQVPEYAYKIARNFLRWAPNEAVGPNGIPAPYRYNVLLRISPTESIYTLLMMDAGYTDLTAAKQKIEEWKEATKSLLRYALNLKLAPKRPEFQRMKLLSSYYVYQVGKKLQGAEKILLCMGYEHVNPQEIKYNGEVNIEWVIHTAVDLVLLHTDLELINGLVLGAKQENYKNVILYDILNARSEPSDVLTNTLGRSVSISFQRITRSKQLMAQPPVIPLRAVQHLEVSSDSANTRRSSVPHVQSNLSSQQSPSSPLLQHQGRQPEQQYTSLPSPNSKEDFNKVDKTLDKSRSVGKDIVDPKYVNQNPPIVIARSPSDSVRKGGSIPFDPDNLPAPAYDPHDLEMFYQEAARTPDDSLVSGHISMFIDARSTDFDDFSGPDHDDQLTFRSDDSSHMGLLQRSTAPSTPPLKPRPRSFSGGNMPKSMAGQTPPPKPRPRSFSGGKKLDALKSDPKPTSVPEGVKPTPRPNNNQQPPSQQPPSSPLLQQQGRQQYTSLPSPNSKEDFKVGKMLDPAIPQQTVQHLEVNFHSVSSTDSTSATNGLDEKTVRPGFRELKLSLRNQEEESAARIAMLQRELQKKNDEFTQIQHQLSEAKAENSRLSIAQQESTAFGIEPWKVSRSDVTLEKVIGGGGWGTVHKGKLQVAVKQFYPDILYKKNLDRFKREMQMLALVRHPNILQFIAVVFDENDDYEKNPPYIITEVLDMTLRSAYEKKMSLTMLSIFQDTARALDYLHRRHEPIIHRDVSSANVLLKRLPNDKWVAKLSDLGSANLAKKAYTMNEGARVYCAPEAFTFDINAHSAHKLTPKIDVYSFGIMLCEVTTKTFPDRDKFRTLLRRVEREWPKLHQLIIACTKDTPGERPSMATVLASLETT